ncbi:MAG: BsuBI/PstI family type II restriction endonuclease, partial [Ktedonobacterales bacterium]
LRGNLFAPDETPPPFTCAILNPPYRKISSATRHRKLLRQIGVETSNLYTGFLAAAMQLLAPQGELVAITPRSVCNGPYFRTFREAFLKTMTLRRLHVFDSRNAAFREDDVLQENVILSARKGLHISRTITIAASVDAGDDLIATREVSYEQVVHPGDPQSFIHIVPDDLGQHVTNQIAGLNCSLEQLGLTVSTGRVVDFRAREFLRQQPALDTVPLIYPTHFEQGYVVWPKGGSHKPNALCACERTHALLVPNEPYVLVKRFSAKEEKRRIVAAVYDAERVPCETVGFENHLNYFHRNGHGLNLALARGLAVFLNSTLVDTYFRQFNGHTQVNATDLRNLRYPTLEQLVRLGAHVGNEFPDQNTVDALVREEIEEMAEGHGIDPIQAKQHIGEALTILKALEFPRQQQNERSALTLLAILDLKPDTPWSEASNPLRGITQMMKFFAEHYGKTYEPNTRETVRRQTVHQFLDAVLVRINPDDPSRPTNSGQTVYQIDPDTLELVRSFGTFEWDTRLQTYLASAATLKERYAQERRMARIQLELGPDKTITLSPGGQNILVKQVVEEFAPRFTPGGVPVYVGDTDEKFAYFDVAGLAALGVKIESHGKIPDIIIYHQKENWLVLIEAVTSHGPIDPKRRNDLKGLFATSTAPLVFVTAFLTRAAMREHLTAISWES